jgi:hypothetical protein
MPKVMKIPNLTDRELLIQQSTVLTKVCHSITALTDDNAIEHGKIFDKLDSVVTTKISNKLFFWLIGIIVTIEILLASCLGVMNKDLSTCIADIDHVEKKINRIHK